MVISHYVGARVRRKEDPRLITGSSQYVDDLKLPGMLHVAFVRSSYPHARIRGIDASAAKAMPGVVGVFTGRDLAARLKGKPELIPGEAPHPEEQKPEGIPVPPEEPIAVERALYVGQPIAVVVATSAAVARDAAEAVVVDYEPLPAVIDPEVAMQDGAPQLYPHIPNNIGERWERVHGDIEAAFAQAHVVVKQRFRQQRLAGIPMETRAIVAAPDPLTQGVTVWSSTQAPHWNRNALAAALGLAHGQVRIIAPEVGGRLRCQDRRVSRKTSFSPRWPCTSIARSSGYETRSEHLMATNHGRDQVAWTTNSPQRCRRDASSDCAPAVDPESRCLPAWALCSPGRTDRSHDVLSAVYDIPNLWTSKTYGVLHQHDGSRCLPRRWSTRGGLLHRTDDGPLGPQARQGSR
jgi:aerobic carbon-monoxide dehydrogenase large subunit